MMKIEEIYITESKEETLPLLKKIGLDSIEIIEDSSLYYGKKDVCCGHGCDSVATYDNARHCGGFSHLSAEQEAEIKSAGYDIGVVNCTICCRYTIVIGRLYKEEVTV